MAIDFRKLTTPTTQLSSLERKARLDVFMSCTSDAEMARHILEFARTLRKSQHLNTDPTYSYDEAALYRLIPEIARRLDPSITLEDAEVPKDEERKDTVLFMRDAPIEKLHSLVASFCDNASMRRITDNEIDDNIRDTAKLWVMSASRKTPLAYAFDRLSPGFAQRDAVKASDELEPLAGVFLVVREEGVQFESGKRAQLDHLVKYYENRFEAYDALELFSQQTRDVMLGDPTKAVEDILKMDTLRLRFSGVKTLQAAAQTYIERSDEVFLQVQAPDSTVMHSVDMRKLFGKERTVETPDFSM